MPSVAFIGRLLPTAVALSITDAPEVEWVEPESDLHMRFRVSIAGNDVSVTCETNRWQDDDLVKVYMRAFDLVRAAVDLAGFAKGIGLTVILDKFVGTDGAESQLVPIDPSLAPLCQTLTDPTKYGPALKIVMSDPAIFMALNDLMQAIILPHHAAVNCARAVEGLRRLIAPSASDDRQAWGIFKRALRLDEQYVFPITNISKSPRHGDRKHISGTDVTEATRRSWIIMDRFLALRLLAVQELPAGDFPILT